MSTEDFQKWEMRLNNPIPGQSSMSDEDDFDTVLDANSIGTY